MVANYGKGLAEAKLTLSCATWWGQARAVWRLSSSLVKQVEPSELLMCRYGVGTGRIAERTCRPCLVLSTGSFQWGSGFIQVAQGVVQSVERREQRAVYRKLHCEHGDCQVVSMLSYIGVLSGWATDFP